MFAILPLLSLVLLLLLFHKQGNVWRNSVLLSALTWGILVTLITEGLSLFRLLTFSGLLVSWGAIGIILALIYLKPLKKKEQSFPSSKTPKPSLFLRLLLSSLIFIIVAVGLIALIAPPNNWDSMAYHMSRVVHWMQNQSVAHYPTTNLRQLYQGPWAGFAITHLQILSGGDRLANLIQWLSMIGSIVGVSLIAERLGADLRGQIFSAVACATIPMGILQSSSTQTDYVVSLWLVCFVYYGLLMIQNRMDEIHVPKAGASLGLAILAKGTAYIYAFPFCIWFFLLGLKQLGWKIWKPLVVGGTIVLAVNLGHYFRNFELFGSVLGASEGYKNDPLSFQFLISNIVRNLALHLSTPVRSLNLITIKAVQLIHLILGVDVSEPSMTFPPGQEFDIHSLINHEDLAGNPIHLLSIVVLSICFITNSTNLRRRKRFFLSSYLLAIVCGFILFCYLLTWSPWRSRLHLPLFVLSSAFIGVILSDIIKPKLANWIASALVLLSLIWVFFNESRPLILNSQIIESGKVENIFNMDRRDQYFINRPELQKPYTEAIRFVELQDCSSIGLLLGGNAWEYPLWAISQDNPNERVRLEYVNPANITETKLNVYPHNNFTPCAIIAGKADEISQPFIVQKNTQYNRMWSKDDLSVFISESALSRSE
jgi:4-amino-4-deoxy-L-arabinose transferase-like glycosyltransferase